MALTLLEAIFAPKAWQFLHMPIPLLQSVSEVEGCISCRQGVLVVSEDVVGVPLVADSTIDAIKAERKLH